MRLRLSFSFSYWSVWFFFFVCDFMSVGHETNLENLISSWIQLLPEVNDRRLWCRVLGGSRWSCELCSGLKQRSFSWEEQALRLGEKSFENGNLSGDVSAIRCFYIIVLHNIKIRFSTRSGNNNPRTSFFLSTKFEPILLPTSFWEESHIDWFATSPGIVTMFDHQFQSKHFVPLYLTELGPASPKVILDGRSAIELTRKGRTWLLLSSYGRPASSQRWFPWKGGGNCSAKGCQSFVVCFCKLNLFSSNQPNSFHID